MGLSKEETKDAIKEAFTEWLDKKYAQFGRWAFMSFAATLFAGSVFLVLTLSGWVHK